MIGISESMDFRDHIIAQDDDCDYSESGWVAIVRDGVAALAAYGHCSCYGTWEAICGGGVNDDGDFPKWDWQGTPDELVAMARVDADPCLPGRTAVAADCDYDHLHAVYLQVIQWDERGRQ